MRTCTFGVEGSRCCSDDFDGVSAIRVVVVVALVILEPRDEMEPKEDNIDDESGLLAVHIF
jgi:hypothetical protein